MLLLYFRDILSITRIKALQNRIGRADVAMYLAERLKPELDGKWNKPAQKPRATHLPRGRGIKGLGPRQQKVRHSIVKRRYWMVSVLALAAS